MADKITTILDSKIKKLRIELPNYHFSHSLSDESDNSDFVGRKKIQQKLKSLVTDSENRTGVYLVTGNRGVGKTRLVNKVIDEIEKDKTENNLLPLHINFGHNLNEKDILRLIVHKLENNFKKKYKYRKWKIIQRVKVWIGVKEWAIIQLLEKLIEDITYGTERESGIKMAGEKEYQFIKILPEIGRRTNKSRSVADAREIEMRLLDILKKIKDNIVIVFDELDKIEQGETSNTKASLFSINAMRERQFEILKILSNLKYFLSTAQAKFIFIAGREMYDIYLADVSERSNYIGSIFNSVVYVPSFLTDYADNVNSDITSLTEEFVCKKLIPKDYKELLERENKPCDLKNYREYLKNHNYDCDKLTKEVVKLNTLNTELTNLNTEKRTLEKKKIILNRKKHIKEKEKLIEKKQEQIQEQEKLIEKIKKIQETRQEIRENPQAIQKIIAILQQLIIYLAHISKGAPKKMIQLFESFIIVGKINAEEKERFLVVSSDNNSDFFLTFDYYRQYALGITAYLITPIFNRLSETNIREHSDKLLVSSLRFVDFLFKFHKHTFSWKNLEISPELLDINRSPELKSVAVDLLNFLTQIHINKSSFSLDDYKFDSMIANGIFAMTKTDEVFSALHSFSLDETLSLKEHYRSLLEKAQKNYENNKGYTDSTTFIYSIASLQVVLGDLHYYDDELEEAEMYYENTIHTLRYLAQKNKEQKNKEEDESDETMNMGQLYLFVRNMLKLGAVLEKRKQYDFAYLTYGELCKRIVRERNITISELQAGIAVRKSGDKEVFVKTFALDKLSKAEIEEEKKLVKAAKNYYDNIEPRYIVQDENEKEKDIEVATPKPLCFQNISPNTNDALFKKMTFEGLKLLYLPFIAKLQILEKSHVGGITYNHLKQLDREFEFLTSVIDHPEAKILEADFFSRVADVLYYKNSDLKCRKDEKRVTNHSCTACEYYRKALCKLLNKPENVTPLDLLKESIENIQNNYNMKHCTVLARILSDWGNVFFSCDKRDGSQDCYLDTECYNTKNTKQECYHCSCCICDINACDTNNLAKYINYVKSESNGLMIDKSQNISKMEIAFAMYAVSLKAYSKANLFKRSAYQINKMLRLFKAYEIYKGVDKLGQKAIRSLWSAAEDLNIFEVKKRKKDFECEKFDEKIPLQYTLVDSEISRIRVLVKDLELKMCKKQTPAKYSEKLKKYYDLHITSPYAINYSIAARIYQLRLKSAVNYEVYKILIDNDPNKKIKGKIEHFLQNGHTDITKIFEGFIDDNITEKTKIEILENLIAETISCFKDIIRLSKTIGETYVFNHSFMGEMHYYLSFWVRQYEVYKKNYPNNLEIDKLLKNYIGEEWNEKLSGYYENQQALSHYYKCRETHNEGRAYHNMIDKMCYVKDDYNDRSDHFSIAEERHNILNGKIEERIKDIKERYKDSELYKMDNYFEHNRTNALPLTGGLAQAGQ